MGETRGTAGETFDPGWYFEPGNPRREGYWDGRAWTGEWREAGTFLGPLPPSLTPAEARVLRADHSTGPAWFIATSPLWLFGFGFVSVWFSYASAFASPLVFGLAAVAIFVSGFADRRLLRARGLAATASPLWGLLGPLVYLFVRHRSLRAAPGSRSLVLPFFLGSSALILVTTVIIITVSSTVDTMLKTFYNIQ